MKLSTFVAIHQILVPEVDLLFEAAAWVARSMLSTLVVEAALRVTMDAVNFLVVEAAFWFPEETHPLQT